MRLLLDTNVWKQLVDRGSVERLRKLKRARGVEVLVCPAVVYELLRTKDPALRRRQLMAATLGVWTQMRTEIYVECEDLRRVINAHRTEWLREDPDLADYHRLRADWSRGGGFWRRARHDDAGEARRIATLEGDLLDRAREEARERRASMPEDAHFDSLPLHGWTGRPEADMPGWKGDDIEVWRLISAGSWWDALRNRRPAYVDWLGPFVDLDRLAGQERSFNALWLYELSIDDVPREWLRWAVMWLQSVRRVTPGTPGDMQIATYLYDADLFLSGDKAAVEIVGRVAPHAPRPLAEGLKLDAAIDPVDQIDQYLGP